MLSWLFLLEKCLHSCSSCTVSALFNFIAELFADPAAYEGKTIRVRGEVAKYNPGIMERNWVHLQDGTEFDGKYDLTVTSQESFQVGQVTTIEGIFAMNRDFGYGYSYEILLEQATVVR